MNNLSRKQDILVIFSYKLGLHSHKLYNINPVRKHKRRNNHGESEFLDVFCLFYGGSRIQTVNVTH